MKFYFRFNFSPQTFSLRGVRWKNSEKLFFFPRVAYNISQRHSFSALQAIVSFSFCYTNIFLNDRPHMKKIDEKLKKNYSLRAHIPISWILSSLRIDLMQSSCKTFWKMLWFANRKCSFFPIHYNFYKCIWSERVSYSRAQF